jgi:hypothetical protein
MNIARVADEQTVPSWFASVSPESCDINEVKRLNISENINDILLTQECDRIEVCAESGETYHYNSKWDSSTVSHLKEYAVACGMDLSKFRGFDPKFIDIESKSNLDSTSISRTASTQVVEPEISLADVWKDPFNIDKHSDTSHMDLENWQTVKKQKKLNDISVVGGNILPLRGEENYFLNSDVNPASNQNSITNPDAIGKLAKSTEDDNGVRLKKQIAEKASQKIKNHSDWQQGKIDEMKFNDIVSKGKVFPTETLNASTGLNKPSSQMGVYAKFDPSTIPEQTEGEMISINNSNRKASIQRPKSEDDWQKPCRQSSRSISDDFVNALSSKLEQLKK